MSALRTARIIKPSRLSPPSSSKTVFKLPEAKFNFWRNETRKLTLTHHHPTHLVKTAESPPVMAQSDTSSVDPTYCEIIVVRHGETAWNVDGKIQGHLDVELNEVGREQAVTVANRLSMEFPFSVVYSSDLKRALETAKTIANACGGLEVIEDPDLRERHLGDLQGLVFREAAESNPKAYKAFSSQKTVQDIPGEMEKESEKLANTRYAGGGESLDRLFDRCTSALERIGRKHKGERIVVVTHGGVIRSLYQWACPNIRRPGKIMNTSLNTFHLSDRDEWTVKTWGDVSHLNQTGFLQSGFGGDGNSG